MALGGLLLLLQVGITRAWKERSTLGEGREMERGTATTPRKSLETRQVRDPAIEEVRRTAKLSSAKSNSKVLFNSRPGKISLSKLSRPDQPRTYARLASYVLPFGEEPQTQRVIRPTSATPRISSTLARPYTRRKYRHSQ
jgi:hypothetical protein